MCSVFIYSQVVSSLYVRLDMFLSTDGGGTAALQSLGQTIDAMRVEATAVVSAGLSFLPPHERPPAAEVARAFCRYVGQGHEIAVEFAPSELFAAAAEADGFAVRLRGLFEEEYRRQFSREIPNGAIEVLSWGLTVLANVVSDTVVARAAGEGVTHQQEATTTLELWDTALGANVAVPVFQRSTLAPGMRAKGPCIVVEENTSTVVNSSFALEVLPSGDLSLTRQQVGARATI